MAQDTIDGFKGRIYRNAAGQAMPYRLFIPSQYDKNKTYPLFVWLHGAGGIGDDNRRQISADQVPGTRLWTKSQNQERQPMFVLVPQSPLGWASSSGSLAGPEAELVLDILAGVRAEFRIDPKRIYLAGQSNGGLGAWGLLIQNPDYFAAAIFVCSAGSFPSRAPVVAQVPIWIFQGDKDAKEFVSASRSMVAALQQAGGHPRYTEYRGAGHDIWDRVFKEPMLVNWLFAQHK